MAREQREAHELGLQAAAKRRQEQKCITKRRESPPLVVSAASDSDVDENGADGSTPNVHIGLTPLI